MQVGVDRHHCVSSRVVEARRECGLMAEVARKTDGAGCEGRWPRPAQGSQAWESDEPSSTTISSQSAPPSAWLETIEERFCRRLFVVHDGHHNGRPVQRRAGQPFSRSAFCSTSRLRIIKWPISGWSPAPNPGATPGAASDHQASSPDGNRHRGMDLDQVVKHEERRHSQAAALDDSACPHRPEIGDR